MNVVWQWLGNNLWYKLSALLLAILVWAIVQGEEILEINKNITITVVTPEGRMLREDPQFSMSATIKGPRILVGHMADAKDLETSIFLSKEDLGDQRFRITKDYFSGWDDRIQLVIHEPASIQFFIDEMLTKSIPLREVITGAPQEGRIVEKVNLNPKQVEVSGLKSELSKARELYTEAIDVNGLAESFSTEAKISTRGFSRLILEQETVDATVQIGEAKANRVIRQVLIHPSGTEYKTTLQPRFASIEIQAIPSVLASVSHQDLRAFIDLSGFDPGRHEREIQVKIPPDTILIEVQPEKVVVMISDSKIP